MIRERERGRMGKREEGKDGDVDLAGGEGRGAL